MTVALFRIVGETHEDLEENSARKLAQIWLIVLLYERQSVRTSAGKKLCREAGRCYECVKLHPP